MAGLKAFQRLQYGLESTAGTAVAAGKQFRGNGGMIDDQSEHVFPDELTSLAVPTTRQYIPKVMTAIPMADTEATFEQLPVILSAAIVNVTTGVADGAGSDLIYAYPLGTTTLNTVSTYTLETGDNQQAEETEYAFVTDFTLKGNAGESLMMGANWVGRQTTKTSFTSSTIPVVEEILAGQGAIYIDAVGGTIGATAVSEAILAFELSVTTGWKPKFFIDGGQLYFTRNYYDIGAVDIALSVTFEHDAVGVAAKDDWIAQAARQIRLQFTGDAVATGGTLYSNKELIIDVTGSYSSIAPLSDQEGNSIYVATLRGAYDATAAITPLSITVVNEEAII